MMGTRVRLAIALVMVTAGLCACGGGASGPGSSQGPGNTGQPALKITTEALHGCSLDGVTVSQIPGAVSIEFQEVSTAGKYIRLTFPEGSWPDPDAYNWTIQPGDQLAVATAVAISGSTADIGAISSADTSSGPVVINIQVEDKQPPDSAPRQPVLSAKAEKLSVTDLGDDRVKLDWVQALPGDFDFNGKVELTDLAALAKHLGESVEYSEGADIESGAYWLDSDHDGLITPEDGAAVAQNLSEQIAGYLIAKDGPAVNPEAPGTVSVSVEQSEVAGRPPHYSVELKGSTNSDWAVAAVDQAGRVGDQSTPVRRSIDLTATVNIFGIDLQSFPKVGDQGGRPGKIGARVIEPIDVVHRGTISAPVLSDDIKFQFAGVPRNRDLMLDIDYVPTLNLLNGEPLVTPAGPVESLSEVENSVATAIPFNIPNEPGMGQLNIDIFIQENPQGGYMIEVNTASVMPGEELPTLQHTLLNYSEGILSVDPNGDNQFDSGWQYPDADRDNVSDSWIEQNQQLDQFGNPPQSTYSAEGTVLGIDQGRTELKLGDITWYGSPQFGDPLTLNYSEWTLFMDPNASGDPMLSPASLPAGTHVVVEFYVLRDPAGQLPDSIWLNSLFLFSPPG